MNNLAVVNISTKRAKEAPTKLTNTIVSKALTRAKRYDINDTATTGFRLRINTTGTKKFIATGRVRGTTTTRTLTIGDADILPLEDARKLAIEFLSKLQLGIDATQVKADAVEQAEQSKELAIANQVSLNDAMEQYLSSRDLSDKTKASYRYELPMYCAVFLNQSVQDITEDEVCKWYLANNHRPTSTDKAFRSFKAIMQYMVGIRVLQHNPCEAVNVRKIRYKIKARTKFVESHNMSDFIDSWIGCMGKKLINPVQGDYILMLFMTGLRLDEARTLKWSDIDYKSYTITIADTKNGHAHVVPLTPLMLDMLDRRKLFNPKENPYVFPARKGRGMCSEKHLVDVRKTLKKIAEHGKTTLVSCHDIRRSFATILEELNISEANIKALMNHQDGTVTRKHYIQAANIETKRANLGSVCNYLEESATVEGLHPDTNINEVVKFACSTAIRNLVYGTAELSFTHVKGDTTALDILNSMR